jgi:molybdopterin-guanine dinucleotide biosynthesis protein A
VLAGGASGRFGRDKAELMIGGESLTARAAGKLRGVCSEVAVADGGRGRLPGLRSLADGPGAGPPAGLLGAARAFPGRPLLVLACDLPEVPPVLLAELAASRGCDWAVPRWSRGLEPLCALYHPAALEALAGFAGAGPHRLADVATLRVRYLDEDLLARFGLPEDLFVNVNTEQDLTRWRTLSRRGEER